MAEESPSPDLVERTRRSFEAASRSDWDAVMGFFAHDAVWEVPELQAFEGQDAIRGFLEDWVGAYQDANIEVEDLLDLGGGITHVTATLNGRLADSTGHMRVRFGATYRWVGDLIVYVASYPDIDEARAAAERLAEEAK
jgi:ketosteroid isomerase-like protein